MTILSQLVTRTLPVPDFRDASVPGASSSWSDRCLDFPRVRRWECGAAPFTSTFRSMNSGGRVGEQGLDQVSDMVLHLTSQVENFGVEEIQSQFY